MITTTQLINRLYSLDFSSNTFADKKHENSVKDIFIEEGFKEITKDHDYSILLKNRNLNCTKVESLKGQYLFIEQPFGSQKFPDFIICCDGFIIWIECKSGKTKITWNTGFPKNDILVVFSSKTSKTTTLFFGQHTELLEKNSDFEENYNLFDKKLKKLANEIFGEKFISTMFTFYMRKMLNDKTKYTNSTVRTDFYEKVIITLNKKGEF